MPVAIKTNLLLLLAFLLLQPVLCAQNNATENADLTVVYDISVLTKSNKTGIAETYNGGIKTLLLSGNKARLRMVTLMRIQNIYFYDIGSNGQSVIMTKESGINKYKYQLSANEWKQSNKKYQDARLFFSEEKKTILGYPCKKVIIQLVDGDQVIAYYSTQHTAVSKLIEPMFEKIPGLVLRYETFTKKGSISYQASAIHHSAIDELVFKKPGSNYNTRKIN